MIYRHVSKEFQKHLEEEHRMSPLSTYLKEIVYGGNDGIITTFAVVAGFAGAQSQITSLPVMVVLLFGLANLFADGASMGLSNFLSLRAEQDLYDREWKKEKNEIRTNREFEEQETIELLMLKGFSRTDAKQLTSIYSKNETYWTNFMMTYELEVPDPREEKPHFTALATFFSFAVFGFIPLMPYVFLRGASNLFFVSVAFTFIALLLLGYLRWQITKHTLLRSIGEVVLVGSVSAVFAYIVGMFFRV